MFIVCNMTARSYSCRLTLNKCCYCSCI